MFEQAMNSAKGMCIVQYGGLMWFLLCNLWVVGDTIEYFLTDKHAQV